MRLCFSGNLRHALILCRACGMAGLSLFVIANAALAQSPDKHGTVPNLSGFFRHNTSVYSPPAHGGPGPVGDLPGHQHGGSDPWVGDHLNPILKEHTAAEIKRLNELELAGGKNLASFQFASNRAFRSF